MVRAAALIFLALASPASGQDTPWTEYQADRVVEKPTIWQATNASNEHFRIVEGDLEANGNWVSFWLRGEHSANPRVKYRTSLWKMTIVCEGRIKLEAFTFFDANGSEMESSDQQGAPFLAIRPDTMYAEIAKRFCK